MNSQSATLRLAVFPQANLITDALLVLAGTALVAAGGSDLGQAAVYAGADHGPDVRRPSSSARRSAVVLSARRSAMLYRLARCRWHADLRAPRLGVERDHERERWIHRRLRPRRRTHRLPRGAAAGTVRLSSSIGLMLTGNVVIYLVGLPWLAVVLNTNLEKTLEYGLYPFIPG